MNILKKNTYEILLFLVVVFIVFVIKPFGEFAVNDDWYYHASLNKLVSGDFNFDSRITPSLTGQLIYTYFPQKISKDYSFVTAKLSVFILSVILIYFLFSLFVKIGVRKKLSFLLCLLVYSNPIFLYLSLTYMTDIPALSFIIIGIYFTYKGLQQSRYLPISIGLLLWVYATFIRQTSIIILLMFCALFLWEKRKTIILKDIIVTGLPIAVFFIFYILLLHVGWWPISDVYFHLPKTPESTLLNVHKSLNNYIVYYSLFLSPLILSYTFTNKQKIFSTGLSILLLVHYYIFTFLGSLEFRPWGNIINEFGIGPRSELLSGSPPEVFSYIFWIVVFISGIVLFPYFLCIIFDVLKNRARSVDRFFSGFLVGCFVIINFVNAFIFNFDRYILVPFVLLIIAFAFKINDIFFVWKFSSFLALLLIAVLSVLGVSDVMKDTKIRWEAAENIQKQGVEIKDIDGGYEWLGWKYYDSTKNKPPVIDLNNPWYIRRLFPDNSREYVVSYDEEITGYRLIENSTYFGKLMMGNINIYTHKREDDI